jgi:hypothetical protein
MAHKQRTPFTLKSGNAAAFKNMGSYSPMMQTDATTTTKKTGLGKLLGDVKSLVQNVGTKLKEGRAAAISKEKDRKEVDSKRTGVERMNRKGKSQYQLDQMDAAEARKKKKSNEAPSGQETVSSRPDLQKGGKTRDVDSDGTPDFIQKPSNEDKNGGANEVETPQSKGNYYTFSGKKGDKFKYRNKSDGSDFDHKTSYEFQRPGSDVWETSKTKAGGKAIHDLFVGSDPYNIEITPIQRKSPLEKGIGKYAKKAKGSRGYKINK